MVRGVNYHLMNKEMKRRRIKSKIILWTIIAVIFAFVGWITYNTINHANHKEIHVVTVTEKGIKRISETDKYMIYTEDENGKTLVFENTDSILVHKYDSADMYQKIKVGKKYRFETRGYRFEVWSQYPNVVAFEEVK